MKIIYSIIFNINLKIIYSIKDNEGKESKLQLDFN